MIIDMLLINVEIAMCHSFNFACRNNNSREITCGSHSSAFAIHNKFVVTKIDCVSKRNCKYIIDNNRCIKVLYSPYSTVV